MAIAKDHDPYEALRVPGYLPYITGGVLSSIGLEIQAVAVAWELYQRTGSVQMLGFTHLAQFLPVLLFALPAGQLADRFNRRKIFQCAQGVSALASLGLAYLSFTEGWISLIFLFLVISGTGRAFSAPSRTSLLPQIIPMSILPNGVKWNSTTWQVANALGPSIGGVLVAISSHGGIAYLTAAGCALTCVGLLFLVHPKRQAADAGLQRNFRNLLAGVRFVWKNNLLLAAISIDLFAVLLGGAVALLPVYAKEVLSVEGFGFGLLRAAPAIGAVLMAGILTHTPPMQRPGIWLLVAVAGFGVATIVFGLSEWYPLSFVMLLMTGALDNISVVVRGTLMQMLTPDEMRGRVAAVNSLFISSSNELGGYESGQVAAWFGPVFSVVSGGVGTIAVVIMAVALCPQLVRLGPFESLRRKSD